jgi:P pilus assembly chaperone PapD
MVYRLLVLSCACVWSTQAWAISVSPITAALDLATQRTHVLTVTNPDTKRSLPVKVSAKTWRLDSSGVDHRNATDDIVVFPGQFVLAPMQRRSVRVATRYKEKPEVERTYRIIVRELPIGLDGQSEQKIGVRLVTSYATAFYVRPLNPQSRLLLSSVVRSSDGLVFKIRNEGNAHSHLRKLTLIFSQKTKTLRIDDPQQLPHFINENLLAEGERHFHWRWPEDASSFIDPRRAFDVQLEVACESCEGGHTVLQFSLP